MIVSLASSNPGAATVPETVGAPVPRATIVRTKPLTRRFNPI